VLVQLPIEALRTVFGPRVWIVGACDPSLVSLADGVIPDAYPGIGPIGGIVSALAASRGPVFVLAGDMPGFTSEDVRRVLSTAALHPDALAVLAATERTHPCAGVYRSGALPMLARRVASGEYRLWSAIPAELTHTIPCTPSAVVNINTRTDAGLDEVRR